MAQQNNRRPILNFCQGAAFALILSIVVVVIHLLILYCIKPKPLTSYAIVFDAGSSHTEMFIYSWPADKSDGLGTTSAVNETYVCQLTGITVHDKKKSNDIIKLKAISDFEDHPGLLEEYFRPCLNKALEKIPSNRHKYSLIFLGATAGMRLLDLRSPTKSKQILETIREVFSKTPFQFILANQVRILTGVEEAIDGWITTNILADRFDYRQKSKPQSVSGSDLDSNKAGVIDLGGASTQVTFTHKNNVNDEPIPSDFTTNIDLFNATYSPYAYSYLCWGKNEALKRYRARLLNAAFSTKENYIPTKRFLKIRDPCLAMGTNDSVRLESLFASPCTDPEKQRLKHHINTTSLKFIGSGNAMKCRQNILDLFDEKRNNKSFVCPYKQEYCTFDHVFQPKIPENIDFIALSGYYYVFNNLAHGMPKSSGATTERYNYQDFPQEEIDRRLINVCETHYPKLYQQESMTPSTEPFKKSLCFDGWYMWLLLTHGIGFTKNHLKRLTFANTLATGKVGWTLGYAINQTNYIQAEIQARKITEKSFIGWLSGSLTLLLIALIFLLLSCYFCLKKQTTVRTNNKDGYAEGHEPAHV